MIQCLIYNNEKSDLSKLAMSYYFLNFSAISRIISRFYVMYYISCLIRECRDKENLTRQIYQ